MASRVFIVEDERDIRDLVLFHLQREGYQVSSASSGEEALRQVRDTPPHLVLLDLMLPAMGGLEVCRTLRQEPSTAALPIVMLTAKGDEVFKIPIPQNAPKHSASGRQRARKVPDSRPRTRMLDSSRAQQYPTS